MRVKPDQLDALIIIFEEKKLTLDFQTNFFLTKIMCILIAMCFYLETGVHEPRHLKDINQVQDVRVVILHALKGK